MTLPRNVHTFKKVTGTFFLFLTHFLKKKGACHLFIFLLVLTSSSSRAQTRQEPLFTSMNPIYEHIRVKEVISTDTLYLENDEKVRLIGLKAPLAPRPEKIERDQFGFVIEKTRPFETLEERALDFAKELLEDNFIRLEFDSKKRGEGNILLAYVYLADTGTFVNEEILKQGYASLSLSAPNLKHAEKLRAAYQTARQEKRGLQGE